MKAIVIGAGISGLSCAYLLQKEGFEVTVLEKEITAVEK
jgi:oxygen-dependent protoporphyrinogen oxidase